MVVHLTLHQKGAFDFGTNGCMFNSRRVHYKVLRFIMLLDWYMCNSLCAKTSPCKVAHLTLDQKIVCSLPIGLISKYLDSNLIWCQLVDYPRYIMMLVNCLAISSSSYQPKKRSLSIWNRLIIISLRVMHPGPSNL